MADYFIEKRKDYSHSKILLEDLNKSFSKDPRFNKDPLFKRDFEGAAAM